MCVCQLPRLFFVCLFVCLFVFFFSVNQTEFVVPRTLPFIVPANITRGYSCNEFAHTVQSKVINLVRLSVNHTRYQFDRLCLATSRHRSTPVAVVNITEENLAVAKSDLIPAVEPIGDTGYNTNRSNVARSDLLAEEDEGYEEVHDCTEDAYGKKICGEDESTMVAPESTVTHTDTTVKSKVGLPKSDGSSSSQLAKVSLSSATPQLPHVAVHWHDKIPDAEESSESSTSSKTYVAGSSTSSPLSASSMYLNHLKKGESLPSHPPDRDRSQVSPSSTGKPPPHRNQSQVSPSSTGKPPPHAGEWEEPKQEVPWEVDAVDAKKPDPVPQIETMPPIIKLFTTLAGEDVSRSCSKGGFSDSIKQEAPMSSAPLRFVAYPQSPRRTLTFHDCEMSADSAYGSVSTM